MASFNCAGGECRGLEREREVRKRDKESEMNKN